MTLRGQESRSLFTQHEINGRAERELDPEERDGQNETAARADQQQSDVPRLKPRQRVKKLIKYGLYRGCRVVALRHELPEDARTDAVLEAGE